MSDEWRARAACRRMDPEVFIQEEDEAVTEVALAVCLTCPVKFECLQLAVACNEKLGVWGGRTSAQRRGDRRAAARVARRDTMAS